ncbi:MAG: phosphate permease [Bacteroidetes bacterium HGW-Bacteroidetes-8]|jgi:phosphate/sulfate permease|nr:MAG: phosphate permease [Bacteroidetes bacterium HGW-Bacteroidetes-8]
MESIYLILIIVLFLLAISDLIVGVSNDAVNFLNSAVGSKAASIKILMIVAAVGVLAGTVFSGGMMEIARSGVFYPDKFTFAHIMLIFLAVMITDVVLLDAFNTIGFPTSTTVSLVFELLGASVAIAVFNIAASGESTQLGEYINAGKALTVVSGILISILIAFTVGAIIQYFTRLIFTFNYEKKLKYLGGLFGGVAITTILYFILIKGAKDAAFMTPANYQWIKENSSQILLLFFAGITTLLYLLNFLFKINVLKIVVLAGTFALAMAFAGNDLVNFIGVPLAGYDSFMSFINSPGASPDTFTMESLSGAVKTPHIFLLLSGVIMVITLYRSKKARTVIMTEVNLTRQDDDGEERFGSSALSRGIVSISLGINNFFSAFLPERYKKWVSGRFAPLPQKKKEKNLPAFDLLRASVNLVVSSALIALGTSLKLPLSTTYVTFMVAMSTSLSDGAWDRESAVYRITGVFSVIGGWFFTAISAFTLAFILASLFFYGGVIAIFAMISLAVFMAYRTHRIHLKKEETGKASKADEEALTSGNENEFFIKNAQEVFTKVNDYYYQIIAGTESASITELKTVRKNIAFIQKRASMHRKILSRLLKGTVELDADQAYFTIRTQDNLLEIISCIDTIACASYKHLANYHKPFNHLQFADLKAITAQFTLFLNGITQIVAKLDNDALVDIENLKNTTESEIEKISKNEVKRIREEMTGNRNSILFMSILQETRNIVYFSSQFIKNMNMK